ncbi:hypothetical protein H0H93_011567 [Arthromyces matolae]|nr:hypothetical protein H0H93_011567 [Arthromyces matolae]
MASQWLLSAYIDIEPSETDLEERHACALSKIKCDLQHPCSKCVSRGRECVFVNNPAASRAERLFVSKPESSTLAPTQTADVASPSTSPLKSFVMSDPTVSNPRPPSILRLVSSHSKLSSTPSSSTFSSAKTDFFETNISTVEHNREPKNRSWFEDVNAINADEMLFELFGLVDTSPGPGDNNYRSIDIDTPPTFAVDFGPLPMVEDLEITLPLPLLHHTLELEAADLSTSPAKPDHDLYFPLFHVPTWIMGDKPISLVRAMQAGGALFARTDAASTFIEDVLSSSQHSIPFEFATLSDEPRDQNRFLLTVILLQTIALFHLKAERAMSSNIYHEILITMIRRQGIIPRINSWIISEMNMDNLESAWKEWANCEMIKRAVLLSFLHDCSLSMYFGFKPSFHPSELDLCLPCDDSVWQAPDAAQWYILCQLHSIHDDNTLGFPMQRALSVLGETRLPRRMAVLFNPLSSLILIHAILRNLFAPYSAMTSAGPANISTLDTEFAALGSCKQENPLAIQLALNNWLQGCVEIPESTLDEASKESDLAEDALSFYWLAQLSLLGLQNGTLADFRQVMTVDVKEAVGGRFRLLKLWLDRIKSLLKSGNGASVPSDLWEELSAMGTK